MVYALLVKYYVKRVINFNITFRIEDELFSYIAIQRGVRQGCVLSPYLFNIYTEFIFREVEELEGININGKNINNIRYADDTALLANSESRLQVIVD